MLRELWHKFHFFVLFFVNSVHFHFTYFCHFRSHTVLLGVHNFQNSNEIQTISVQQVFPHTNYNATSYKDDIMLLKVKKNHAVYLILSLPLFSFLTFHCAIWKSSLQILYCLHSYHWIHFLLNMSRKHTDEIRWTLDKLKFIFQLQVGIIIFFFVPQVELQSTIQQQCETHWSRGRWWWLSTKTMCRLWLGKDQQRDRLSVYRSHGS